jgi:cleavage stimulation factor subunit 1
LSLLVQEALSAGASGLSGGTRLFGLTKEEDDVTMEGGGATDAAAGADASAGASSSSAASDVKGGGGGGGGGSSAAAGDVKSGAALLAAGATKGSSKSKTFPNYSVKHTITHKNAVTCAKFSADGQFVVTGSADCSIKILEVSKMHFSAAVTTHKSSASGPAGMMAAANASAASAAAASTAALGLEKSDDPARGPLYRAYFDHAEVVNDVDFHPIEPFVVSGSMDGTIKFYDHSKVNLKRCVKYLNESHNVRSLAFHPSGDFLLAGTEHPMVCMSPR